MNIGNFFRNVHCSIVICNFLFPAIHCFPVLGLRSQFREFNPNTIWSINVGKDRLCWTRANVFELRSIRSWGLRRDRETSNCKYSRCENGKCCSSETWTRFHTRMISSNLLAGCLRRSETAVLRITAHKIYTAMRCARNNEEKSELATYKSCVDPFIRCSIATQSSLDVTADETMAKQGPSIWELPL